MNQPAPINNLDDLKRILEAALMAAEEPLSLKQLSRMFEQDLSTDMLRRALEEIRETWQGKCIELAQVAEGWRFQTTAEVQPYLARLRNEKPPRYSRAVMETLAIIAYRQPVTRGDIEDIRGVSVNAQIVKSLEDRGWIESIGHRDVPGRPSLYATTARFLTDLGLRSLQELPPLEDIGSVLAPDHPEQIDAALDDVPPVSDEDEQASGPGSAGSAGREEARNEVSRIGDPDDDSQQLAARGQGEPGHQDD
jgi:segregation and condensation protein B